MSPPRTPTSQRLDLPDADVRLWPAALSKARADAMFAALFERIAWQEEEIVIFGRRRLVPRLVAWHGDAHATYAYSGVRHEPQPWLPELRELRDLAVELTGHDYDSVLLNLYRDGRDAMGWHADDEAALGPAPAIASFSLGAVRRFRLRHRRLRDASASLDLPHGSLLLMAGGTQQHYVHSVARTARLVGPRINLTYRMVAAQD